MYFNSILAIVVSLSTWQLVVPACQIANCSDKCSVDPWQGGKIGNPGAKLLLNGIAIDYANKLGNQQITNVVSNLRAPDVRIGDLTIYGLKVVDFDPPNYYRKLVQPNYVQWGFRDGKLKIESGFGQIIRRAPIVDGKLTVDNITGIVTIDSSSSSMETSSTMSKDIEGRPTVSSLTCQAKLGLLNVSFSGNVSLPSYTKDLIVRQIQSAFESLLCASARSLIMTAVNAELKTFPSKIYLDKDLILDYSLIENPRVTDESDAIEGKLKGAVYFRTQPAYPFYPPNVWSNLTDNNTMMEFHLTSYVMNTLFYVAHQQKLLKFFANPQLLSSATAQMLRLNCPAVRAVNPASQICVGSIFRNLTSFGSKSYVNVSMETSEPPKAMFNFLDAFWLGKGRVRMDVVDDSKNSAKLFSADVQCVYGSINPRLYKNTLFATTNVTYLKLEKVDSPMETISDADVNKLEIVVSKIIEELLNGFFSVGFPIPLVDGVSLVDPKMRVLPGSIFVSSNFTYSALPVPSNNSNNSNNTNKTTKSPSTKTTKSPSTKTTKSPSTKTTKSPSTKTTKSPSTKTTKSPSNKTTKSP